MNTVQLTVLGITISIGGNLPPLETAACLPSPRAADQFLEQAKGHERWVRSHAYDMASCWKKWSPRTWFEDVKQASAWVKTWELVVDAAGYPGLSESDRREAIAELIRRHGWNAVLTGQFKPPLLAVGK